MDALIRKKWGLRKWGLGGGTGGVEVLGLSERGEDWKREEEEEEAIGIERLFETS